jgi:hypothetical protein
VSTPVMDERWFILRNRDVVSAALVDGGPPSDSQPMRCAGELSGPTSLTLRSSVSAGRLVLRAVAPEATVVGFALRRNEASDWQGLPLASATGDVFTEQAGAAGPYVAIAAACWASGAPAHPTGPGEYIEALLPLSGAPSQLRTAASTTVSAAVQAACSPSGGSGASLKPAGQASSNPTTGHTVSPPVPVPVVPSRPKASQDLFAEAGSPVTGSDPHGFNIGSRCSDDPASALPGCDDSPSVPIGHPPGDCPNGITIDRQTTSCGLAENVHSSYTEDGSVTARSPKRGRDYTFTCKTAGPGTTHYTICLGRAGLSLLYLRWRR